MIGPASQKTKVSRFPRIPAVLVAAALSAFALTAGAAADSPLEVSDRARLLRENRSQELLHLEAARQRLLFQLQQQQYREQDRGPLRHQLPRPEVPRMQSGCQANPFGRNALAACR